MAEPIFIPIKREESVSNNYNGLTDVSNYNSTSGTIDGQVKDAMKDIIQKTSEMSQKNLDMSVNYIKPTPIGGTGPQYQRVSVTPNLAYKGVPVEPPKADYTMAILNNYK